MEVGKNGQLYMLLQLLDSVKIILPETNNNNRIISEIMY